MAEEEEKGGEGKEREKRGDEIVLVVVERADERTKGRREKRVDE